MDEKKVLGLLGIAMKARKVVSGEVQTLMAVRKGSASLVILPEDATANTVKRFTNKGQYYGVPVYRWGTKESLGRALGKDLRSSVGVCDAGLAKSLIECMTAHDIGTEAGK